MRINNIHSFLVSILLTLFPSAYSIGGDPTIEMELTRMSKQIEKVHEVKFAAYSWDLSRNLAREVLSQGDRLTVYDDLLATALRGDMPAILQPIQAARPNASKEVEFIVAGVGRLTSVRKWESSTPQERLLTVSNCRPLDRLS